MRSQLAERRGVAQPQIHRVPPDVHSLAAAEEAIELADSYGLAGGFPLDESQRITLRTGMAERADGSWCAATMGDFEGRQNGKNDTINARELWGLIAGDEQLIIHTAHEFPTANESFLRLVSVFENYDDLRKRVARIRYANGEQGIEFLTGQRLKYKARTGGSGRGFANADLVVYDEAQHLQAEHVAASGPTRLANPNSQAWYAGSGGMSTSKLAWRMRRRAFLNEPGRYGYVEHTAERLVVEPGGGLRSERPDDLMSESALSCNPAFGWRNTFDNYQTLYDELGEDLFARECLCIWDPEDGVATGWVIPADAWSRQVDPKADRVDPVSFALDVDPDRTRATVGASWRRGDGFHVAVVDNRPGVKWVIDLCRDWGSPIIVDSRSPAGALIPELEESGVEVVRVAAADYSAACGLFFDGIVEGVVFHDGDDVLTEAVAGASRRNLSESWAWDRRSVNVDITPLVATTLALWGAHSQRPVRKPVFAF